MLTAEQKELIFWLDQSAAGAAAIGGTMNRQQTAQYRAAREIETFAKELERLEEQKGWLEKDLIEAKELLRRAASGIRRLSDDESVDTTNHIDAFLDMVRCSGCGERVQHAGFLGDTGECSTCDREKEQS